jgi:murein DD-endopeptidase MepM/ murein hydrolase activator NlpD
MGLRGGYDETDLWAVVVIRHDFGYQGQMLSIYGHLDQIDVAGQYVTTGQQIGLVGETGQVTGPHLHFPGMWQASFLHAQP